MESGQPPVEREAEDPMLTVVFDNNTGPQGLRTSWGFSCLVIGYDRTILFDTGGDGSILLQNMEAMGIDPGIVDVVVLSHVHVDHIGGLSSLLNRNPGIKVHVPGSFPESIKQGAREYSATVVEVGGPVDVCRGVYSTGELGGSTVEQSMVIETEKGLVIVTGCAHPGIVEILEEVDRRFDVRVLLVMGGFHLKGKSSGEIEGIIARFRTLGVEYVGPCHCLGEAAGRLFEREYGDHYLDIGVGSVVRVEDLCQGIPL